MTLKGLILVLVLVPTWVQSEVRGLESDLGPKNPGPPIFGLREKGKDAEPFSTIARRYFESHFTEVSQDALKAAEALFGATDGAFLAAHLPSNAELNKTVWNDPIFIQPLPLPSAEKIRREREKQPE